MDLFLTFAFLFFVGSTLGWVLELFYRRFFSAGKWLNPGFLVGPYLPLYGFGLCLLFLLSAINLSFIPWRPAEILLRVVMMGAAMTLIEYIAGKIFIVGMKVKLWDYSNKPGNLQGIICPEFSFYWTVIGAVYCYGIHPFFMDAVSWLFRNLAFSFVVGMFFGIFLIDFVSSAKLLARLRAYAKENDLIVRLEELKKELAEKAERNKLMHFAFSLHLRGTLPDTLREYTAQFRQYTKDMKAKVSRRKKRKGSTGKGET